MIGVLQRPGHGTESTAADREGLVQGGPCEYGGIGKLGCGVEGKDHHGALRAVALRWVKVIWAMWNNNTLYDQEYHRLKKGDGQAGITASA